MTPNTWVVAAILCLSFSGVSSMMGDATLAAEVDSERYPYLVSLRDPTSPERPHYCNGILVGEKEVVTAAHCVDPKMGGHLLPLIKVGQADSVFVETKDVLVEDTWESNVLLAGDFALLVLEEEVPNIQPATLSMDPEAVRLFGFQFLHSFTFVEGKDTVNEVQLLAREAALCQRIYRDDNFSVDILPGMLCASAIGSEVCTGFSGAPLIIKGAEPSEDVVVGLLSFGTEGCNLPAIYTDVSVYSNNVLKEIISKQKPRSLQPESFEQVEEKEVEEEKENMDVKEDQPIEDDAVEIEELPSDLDDKVEHSRYSYLVSLRDPTVPDHPHYCNGVLVGERQVVTAAHCVDPNTGGHLLPIVHVGRPCHNCDGEYTTVQASGAVADPSWAGKFLNSGDIAIVFLEKPITNVVPATLSMDTEAVRRFGFKFLHSFTYDRTGGVSETQLLAREAAPCQREYNQGDFPELLMQPGMLCASSLGPGDVCQGYSGAPLVIKGTTAAEDIVVGIMSFGTQGCQLPAVYADVAVYANDLLMLMNTAHHDAP